MKLADFFDFEDAFPYELKLKNIIIHCPKKEDLRELLDETLKMTEVSWQVKPRRIDILCWDWFQEDTCVSIRYESGKSAGKSTHYERCGFRLHYIPACSIYNTGLRIIQYSTLKDDQTSNQVYIKDKSKPETLSITFTNSKDLYVVADPAPSLSDALKKTTPITSTHLFDALNGEKLTKSEMLEVSIYRLMDDPNRILNQFRFTHYYDEGVSGIIARAVNEILPDYVRLKNKQEEK